jgi:hypothetical protein
MKLGKDIGSKPQFYYLLFSSASTGQILLISYCSSPPLIVHIFHHVYRLYGCPPEEMKDSCPDDEGKDNWHNFMTYADDACIPIQP